MTVLNRNITKADMLINLKPKLKAAFIEDIKVFTVEEWGESKNAILKEIAGKFSSKPVIVRSSSRLEDTGEDSQAGCFYSEIGVDPSNCSFVEKAVDKVLDQGLRTADIFSDGMKQIGTSEMGDAVVAAL